MQPQNQKSAFLFPGQGVLPVNICNYYLYLKNKDAVKTEKFVSVLQASLDEINPQAQFNVITNLGNETAQYWENTAFVQPLTYTLNILTYVFMKNTGRVRPDYILGHSLGAFSALTAAGALPFELGCRIVTARGKFMQEASEKANNGMCAIIGLAQDKVQKICEKAGAEIALINGPTAFVVGGAREKFAQIELEAAQLGAIKTIILATSGAFHTRAMIGAYKKLKAFLEHETLQKPNIPIVTNMEGVATIDPVTLKNDVIESMINPVNWKRMMDYLKNQTVSSYIEVGPGSSLSSLSRINGIAREQIKHASALLE